MNERTFEPVWICALSVWRIARWLLLVYVCVLLLGCSFSNSLIFHPPRARYQDTDEILKLTTDDGIQISAIHLPNPDATYTMLYSHGNAEDLGDIRSALERLGRLGLSIFAYDYHGYGTSGGKPSERNAYQDVNAAYDYVTQTLGIPPDRIIAYGRSLGGGLAVDLASRKPIAGLITEGAFVTAFRVVTRIPLLPIDKFRNISKIKQVRCPVLVIHGTKDKLISFWHGEKLFKEANEPKFSLWVDGAGHNDLPQIAGSKYDNAVKQFLVFIEERQAKE